VKRFWISCFVLAIVALPARTQKLQVQDPSRGQIVHVRTALDHLTVLEMNGPVTAVAVGSPVFKVEWRENKVFIKPTEENVATNLFVWTAAGRFNYELEPAGSVPEMIFAIDQPVPAPPPVKASTDQVAPKQVSPEEVLIGTKPVRLHGSIPDKKRVAVYLNDLFQHDGQLFIHYTIRNDSNKTYVPGAPQVSALNSARYHDSLYALSNYQLSPGEASRLKSSGEVSIEVARTDMPSPRIEPGKQATGIVAVKLPQGRSGPTVLRLIFLAASSGPISATLVM
jgi:hypothetical protein